MAPGFGSYRSTRITIPPIADDLTIKIRSEQRTPSRSPMEHWGRQVKTLP